MDRDLQLLFGRQPKAVFEKADTSVKQFRKIDLPNLNPRMLQDPKLPLYTNPKSVLSSIPDSRPIHAQSRRT